MQGGQRPLRGMTGRSEAAMGTQIDQVCAADGWLTRPPEAALIGGSRARRVTRTDNVA